MKFELHLALILVVTYMVTTAMTAFSPNAANTEIGNNVSFESTLQPSSGEGSNVGGVRETYIKPFSELAPRQKVMGIVNAIALLRTKISLIDEMHIAFEPQTIPPTAGPQPGKMLPGPALAYGDCRLGILGFDVCRHLGFLEGDPMVAPSSMQSKMLTLVGASSLVNSLKRGQLNLKEDEHLNEIMGKVLVDVALRALNACWNAQLLYPAFDARPARPELIREATQHADEFLFLTAINAKDIIRFSRSSEHDDLALVLAWIFSDTPGNETAPLYSAATMHNVPREESQRMPESVSADKPTDETHQTSSSVHRDDSGIFGGFLNRFFPSSSPQTPQSHQGGLTETRMSPLTALANSVGSLTSVVTSTAQNAVKLVNGESTSETTEEAKAQNDTEMRLASILSMIPDEVDQPI